MRNVYLVTLFVCVLGVSILGFSGTTFTPPLDLFPDWAFPGMEVQPKHRPQAASKFFADGRADRLPPVRIPIARGMLRDDDHLHHGKTASGAFAATIPASLTVDLSSSSKGGATVIRSTAPRAMERSAMATA
jgi:hypothetical protein